MYLVALHIYYLVCVTHSFYTVLLLKYKFAKRLYSCTNIIQNHKCFHCFESVNPFQYLYEINTITEANTHAYRSPAVNSSVLAVIRRHFPAHIQHQYHITASTGKKRLILSFNSCISWRIIFFSVLNRVNVPDFVTRYSIVEPPMNNY